MKKNICFLIAISLFMFIVSTQGFAAEDVIEFGNTICPVSGEEIVEDEAVKYEHNGVVYNFCCKMCLKDFRKDPEKYIKKLEALKEKEEAEEEHSATHEKEHHTHEHHHH